MLAPRFQPLDEVRLPAGNAIAFLDGVTRQPVLAGLRCTLVLRHGLRTLGRSVVTPGGVHHWPDLAERWRNPDPAASVHADVLVQDEQERFLPLVLPWPLPVAPVGQVEDVTVRNGSRRVRVTLLSAPGRGVPPACASVYAQLVSQATEQPAGWARVRLTAQDGRVHEGACDGEGRLALHLPVPRPPRKGAGLPEVPPPEGGPEAPPATSSPSLQVFHDAALAAEARRLQAPGALAFAAQPEVRALAKAGEAGPYAPAPLVVGEPLILVTQGLHGTQRELRLAPMPDPV